MRGSTKSFEPSLHYARPASVVKTFPTTSSFAPASRTTASTSARPWAERLPRLATSSQMRKAFDTFYDTFMLPIASLLTVISLLQIPPLSSARPSPAPHSRVRALLRIRASEPCSAHEARSSLPSEVIRPAPPALRAVRSTNNIRIV
ncbi:hypothetical protein B0H10DRAFT_2240679 [Mycena sp. CBHHK59/15]|nr:hypothetical protein B0H10DRAFT_2240679 [Mycena sp. CBHHK59/15]